MKKLYLALTIIGTLLPGVFIFMESIETGNYLLYADPIATFNGMFANNISAAFVTDLLFVVILFLVWTYHESKKRSIKKIYLVWLYTFAFGIAGGLPLFLYLREKKMEVKEERAQGLHA